MVTEQKLLLSRNQALPRHITNTGIIEELTNLIFAGTDTTGNTLTYLFWELAHHPEWQLRLREELNEALDGKDTYDYNTISELPVLDAVVQETLRLRPAAPSGLQRVTPEAGCVIDGTTVPSRVRTKAFASSLPTVYIPIHRELMYFRSLFHVKR